MRYALFLYLYFTANALVHAAVPVVDTPAQDTIVVCGTDNVQVLLTQWYQNGANAIATDPDGGSVFFIGNISLDSTLLAFEASADNFCGNNMSVTVEFLAVDSDGGTAPAGAATFMTSDNVNPEITETPVFITYECQLGIQDILTNWIQTRGGAQAIDNCSDVTWTTFIWNDTEGNSGLGTIDDGPYPQTLGSCEYAYNVSFIVVDECENQRATTGRFTIIDDTAPIIEDVPEAITVSCDNIPAEDDANIYDFCDPDITIEVEDISTQMGMPSECSFYNYTITRIYTASDACGNSAKDTTLITVADLGPPIINGQDTITVPCIDFSSDTLFISAVDDCSQVTISLSDTPYLQACESTVDRIYTITDVCGNMVTYLQHIIVKDITAPVFETIPADFNVSCIINDKEVAFQSWLSDVLATPITEGCTTAEVFAAVPDSYDQEDISTFPGTSVGALDPMICPSDIVGISRRESVDFVAYDECGNVTIHQATFGIQDTTNPIIEECISNVSVVIPQGSCTADVSLNPVSIITNCADDIVATIDLGNGLIYTIDINQTNILLDVPQGFYTATFTVTDCALNQASCEFSLNIRDEELPTIANCPMDDFISLSGDTCVVEYTLSDELTVADNCGFTNAYFQKLPLVVSNELLTFSGPVARANNETYSFTDVFPVVFNTNVVKLKVNITAAIDNEESYFTVFGEDGFEIGTTQSNNSCVITDFTYTIPIEEFNTWTVDGMVDISLIANADIVPCENVEPNGTDGTSRVSVTLEYSDAELSYAITGATNTSSAALSETSVATLNAGENIITYEVSDASGNVASCSYTVKVTDVTAPTANCKNAVINIPPDGEQTLFLDPSLIDDNSIDLCGEVSLSTRPSVFSCDQVGTEVEVTLIATDVSGNKDSCTAVVKVEPFDLEPSFSSGICENDSLKLFANAPLPTTPGSYTYEWTGPNFSSNNANPVILNATDANNGIYSVTVTGFNGCATIGTVQVNIAPLTTPEISADSDTICMGDELSLLATVYTGNIIYKWYEGSFPDGELVQETGAPSLIISPPTGTHFYYVIASSTDCESNPSAVIRVEVIETPMAAVDDNFLNVCEGESLSIGTSVFGPNFSYQWTGPNGFSSNKPRPETIDNVTLDAAGEYSLVISAANCQSDTAVTRVNIFEQPTTPIITSGETFCEGSTVSLTVNNIQNADLYTWLLNGVVFTTESDNSLVITNAQASNSGSWQLFVKDGICTSDTSDIKAIIIEDLQEISVTNNGPACEGDSLQLLVTFIAGAEYSWTGPGGFESTIQNPKILAAPGEYSVNIITGTNCETTATTTVEVNTAPVITALSNNSQPCMDGETNIVFFPTVVPATGNFDFDWEGPNGFTADILNPVLVNPNEEVNGTYTLTVINENCSSAPVNTEVDITITPGQPSIIIPSATCVGNDIVLTSSISGEDYTYIWNTPSNTLTTDEPTLSLTNLSNTDEGEYSVTIMIGGCISEESIPVELDVTAQPSAPVFTTNSPVCFGELMVLSITNPSSTSSYIWLGPNDIIGMGAEFTLVANDTVGGTYQVLVDDNGCQSALSPGTIVTVEPEIKTPVTESTSYEICNGITETLEICLDPDSAEPGAAYTLTNINTSSVVATETSICFLIDDMSVFDPGTNFLTIQAEKGGCLSAVSAQFRVELSEVPAINANIEQGDITLCSPEDINLTAQSGPPLIELQWSSTSSLSFSDAMAKSTIVKGVQPGTSEIVLSYSQNACTNYSSDTVSITLLTTPEAEDDEYESQVAEELILDILDNDQVPLDYSLTIVEIPLIGSASVEEDMIIYIPDGRLSGTVTFSYELCAVGCPDQCSEAEVTIVVGDEGDCISPTIITPNGDNINDNFVVPCLDSGTYTDSELVVFNQWGDEIYSARNYSNDWGGTFEGKALAAGTYFYILDLGDGTEPLHSFLIIQL